MWFGDHHWLRTTLGETRFLLGPHQGKKWLGLILLGVLASLVEVVGATMIMILLTLVSNPQQPISLPLIGDATTILPGDETDRQVAIACLALTAFFLIRAAVLLLQVYASARVVQNSGARLASRLADGYLRMPYAFHLRRNSAELIRNLFQSITVFTTQVLQPATNIVADAFVLLGLSVVLFVVAPSAALLSVLVLSGIVLVLLKFVQPRLKQLGRAAQDANRHDLQTMQQALGGVRDMKILASEPFFSSRFRAGRYYFARTEYLRNFLTQVPRTAIETLLILAILALLGVSVAFAENSDRILPTIGLFAYAGLRLQPALQRIVSAANSFKYAGPALADLTEALRIARLEPEEPTASKVTLSTGSICLTGVTFRYENSSHDAVDAVDLLIPFGSALGVVGSTGSGKSTLVDLIIGLLKPTRGVVSVDGVDIRNALPTWYEEIGIVSQTPYLLDSSVRDNVVFGRRGSWSDAQIYGALERAQVADFIRTLPSGLDTHLGERGSRVSGGQRQRIAIARALLAEPSVLVLDEGTAALDSQTESALMAAISGLGTSVTKIIVAHRLSTIRHCDQVVLMEAGSIRDQGTFGELHARDALFRNLSATP